MDGVLKKRILVIDDEEVILFSYKKIFQGRYLDVEVCSTPESAYEKISEIGYDAIISDLRFSDSEGREGLDILRYVKRLRPGTPMIVTTGYGNPEIREEAISSGAIRYFDKPVAICDMEEVLLALGIHCGGN